MLRAAATVLVLLAAAAPAAAQPTLDLSEDWRMRAGDDPRWADVDLDDSDWTVVSLPEPEDEALPTGGFVWFRRHVAVDDRWNDAPLAVSVGGSAGNTAYEVFVDGSRVGGAGELAPEPVIAPAPSAAFAVDPSALDDGELVVALRVFQPPIVSLAGATVPRFTQGVFEVGPRQAVERGVELAWSHRVPYFGMRFISGTIFLVLAFFHLLIWRGRRELAAYFWYAAFVSQVGGAYFLAFVGEPFWPEVPYDVGLIVGHVLFAWGSGCAWEFVFAFYGGVPRPRWFRYYWAWVVIRTGLALVPAIAPTVTFIALLTSALEFLLALVVVIVGAIRGGRAERIATAGGLFYIAVMLTIHLNTLGVIDVSLDPDSPIRALRAGGPFFLWVVTMAYALADKFDSKLRELDSAYAASTRFVPADFLRLLGREQITSVKRGDSVGREMSVLFADIRGFTALSERLGPEKIFAFMNDYHSVMGPVVAKEGGFINQYYGDGIMALFEEPDAALRAARGMLEALDRFNAGHDPIEIGIGVHTGDVVLGTIGDAERLDTGVIGDAVNTAARVQEMTKEHGRPILVTGATRDALTTAAAFSFHEVGEVTPRGRQESITLLALS